MSAGSQLPLVERPENVRPELVVDWNVYDPPRAREIGPHLAWKKLQDGPDIVWTPRNGGHWIVTRGEDVDFIQRNHDPFSFERIPEFQVKPGEQVTYLPGIVNCIGRLPLSWLVKS